MKRYTNMAAAELLALTDEQVEDLVRIELMVEGIEPVEMPEKPSLSDVGIVESEIGFVVGGLIFEKEDDALEKYDWTIGRRFKWFEPIVEKTPTKTMAFKQADVMRVSKVLQDNERKSDPYARAQNDYSEYLRKSGDKRNGVWGAVNNARKAIQELNAAKAVYAEYLRLADGDEETAKRFFVKTYAKDEDLVKQVFGGTGGPEPVEMPNTPQPVDLVF